MIDQFQLQILLDRTGIVLSGIQELSGAVVSQLIWGLLDETQKKTFAAKVLETTLSGGGLSRYFDAATHGKEEEIYKLLDLDEIRKALVSAAVRKIDSNEYETRSLLSGAIKRIETLVTEAADAFLRDYPDLLQAQVIARVSDGIVAEAVRKYAQNLVEAVKNKTEG